MPKAEYGISSFPYTIEAFEPQNPEQLSQAVKDIAAIETAIFGAEGWDEADIEACLTLEPSLNMVIRDPQLDNRIVGYIFVIPSLLAYAPGQEYEGRPADTQTAYVGNLAIAPSHQHKHLFTKLMEETENVLRASGCTHFEGDYSTKNHLPDKLESICKGRIVTMSDPHDSEYGTQVFCRIRL